MSPIPIPPRLRVQWVESSDELRADVGSHTFRVAPHNKLWWRLDVDSETRAISRDLAEILWRADRQAEVYLGPPNRALCPRCDRNIAVVGGRLCRHNIDPPANGTQGKECSWSNKRPGATE